jgi:transcriptional regulator with XRE-family HTH domain
VGEILIFPLQISAARTLLNMSQQELARRASVGLGTIKRIEAARQDLTGTAQTLARIERALESAGIVFIDQDEKNGPGVRLRDPIS